MIMDSRISSGLLLLNLLGYFTGVSAAATDYDAVTTNLFIALGIVGVLFVVLAIVLAVVICRKRKRAQERRLLRKMVRAKKKEKQSADNEVEHISVFEPFPDIQFGAREFMSDMNDDVDVNEVYEMKTGIPNGGACAYPESSYTTSTVRGLNNHELRLPRSDEVQL